MIMMIFQKLTRVTSDYADLYTVIIYFKRFFLITIFQEKAENKDTVWETKTTFIIDFKSHNKQISPYNINTFTLGRVEVFQKILTKTIFFETCMQEGTSMVIHF